MPRIHRMMCNDGELMSHSKLCCCLNSISCSSVPADLTNVSAIIIQASKRSSFYPSRAVQ